MACCALSAARGGALRSLQARLRLSTYLHRRGPADAERLVYGLDRGGRGVVELQVWLRERHAPHLVPHLEVPRPNLGGAVPGRVLKAGRSNNEGLGVLE